LVWLHLGSLEHLRILETRNKPRRDGGPPPKFRRLSIGRTRSIVRREYNKTFELTNIGTAKSASRT
jgi:hypothetical protein